ncbi:STAS domain-containing protein [candidate division WOR-3 bacterium]|uniref:STAS domain-containing protein n=1 Tax=candidate division WOR-3 bacterium TaxID=2052148 RepID=A0A9D5KAI4_UNCW3|nr:STAS domain-containing protein [candidate division WOR-3 bacterium]MBD3364639.1 STAS domain-containing protein [candidate division WOR-3 bacterium]
MAQTSAIPILKLREFLIVSIQVDLHDKMAEQLQHDILKRISETSAKGVLVDISALETVDSFIGRTLAETARMAGILDAELVIVGMPPSVASTFVELGLSMGGVRTAINLDEGYDMLEAYIEGQISHKKISQTEGEEEVGDEADRD